MSSYEEGQRSPPTCQRRLGQSDAVQGQLQRNISKCSLILALHLMPLGDNPGQILVLEEARLVVRIDTVPCLVAVSKAMLVGRLLGCGHRAHRPIATSGDLHNRCNFRCDLSIQFRRHMS